MRPLQDFTATVANVSHESRDGPSTASERVEPTERQLYVAARLIGQFALIWPRAWADAVTDVPLDAIRREWAIGLDGLSVEDISHGIDVVRRQDNWPPSIARFRQACRDGANEAQRAFQARAASESTAGVTPSRDVGRRALDEIRRSLGMPARQD